MCDQNGAFYYIKVTTVRQNLATVVGGLSVVRFCGFVWQQSAVGIDG